MSGRRRLTDEAVQVATRMVRSRWSDARARDLLELARTDPNAAELTLELVLELDAVPVDEHGLRELSGAPPGVLPVLRRRGRLREAPPAAKAMLQRLQETHEREVRR